MIAAGPLVGQAAKSASALPPFGTIFFVVFVAIVITLKR
jgi:hypothetical protein